MIKNLAMLRKFNKMYENYISVYGQEYNWVTIPLVRESEILLYFNKSDCGYIFSLCGPGVHRDNIMFFHINMVGCIRIDERLQVNNAKSIFAVLAEFSTAIAKAAKGKRAKGER